MAPCLWTHALSGESRRARRHDLNVLRGLGFAALFATVFIKMYGTLGFISTDQANPFDMYVAASSPATLRLMSIAAAVGVPIVIAYTIWSYSVFRRRISTKHMPAPANDPYVLS